MTIALVLPNLPKYSEGFLANKIRLLQEAGFQVIVMVVGAAKEKPKTNFKVYYQPILAASGPLRWAHSFYLMILSLVTHPNRTFKLLSEGQKAGNNLLGAWRLVAVLSNFLKIKADWVHFAYGTMAVERALIGKVIGAKVGVSFRGFDIGIAPLATPNLYKNVWPYIDKVHSISNDLLHEAQKQGLPENTPTQIIHPAIDVKRFLVENRKMNKIPQLLTVARLHWKKGLEYTLEALAILHNQGIDFDFKIAGDGSEFERLKFAAYQLGILDKVEFLGKVPHDAIATLMRESDYYMQYSIQEGFCNAVLEAQAAGLLCVVSDAEGLPENVLHSQTGWVVPKRNPQALAEKLLQVFSLPIKEKEQIRLRAIARVRDEFNLEKQKQAFIEFYTT
jgi:colanic acid/amylovoran biosynthesis glycosyltransferase